MAAMVLILGPTGALCGPIETFENAKAIGASIRSMMNLRDVALSLERFRAEQGSYPTCDSLVCLRSVLGSKASFDGRDRWGEDLLVSSSPKSYLLSSKGEDRTGDHEEGGAVTSLGQSITLKDGKFVQYFAKAEKTKDRLEQEIAAARSR
jgi:hypothetical protein